MQVKGEELLVKAPLRATDVQIQDFLNKHDHWIRTHLDRAAKTRALADTMGFLSEEDIRRLAEQAKAYIPERAAYYAAQMHVTYGRITIRNQRSRWGSCSAKGNLNFNCLLMLCPPQVIDSVVVHELAHRREMNHSERFYELVLQAFPEYRRWERWLKENGDVLLRRMTG